MRDAAFALVAAALLAIPAAAAPAGAETPEQAGERLMREDGIGPLRLQMTEAAIRRVLPDRPRRTKDVYEAADGMYRLRLIYARQGLVLALATEKKGAPHHLDAISCKPGCGLRTRRGIGIGSPAAKVGAAYAAEFNKEESKPDLFVAGTIYGGLIFRLASGKVSEIFLGAAAE
jgi:hypothetical protein